MLQTLTLGKTLPSDLCVEIFWILDLLHTKTRKDDTIEQIKGVLEDSVLTMDI
ncbi:hypothetical protein RYX36_026275 [Vicia faba]